MDIGAWWAIAHWNYERVRHDLATKQQQQNQLYFNLKKKFLRRNT